MTDAGKIKTPAGVFDAIHAAATVRAAADLGALVRAVAVVQEANAAAVDMQRWANARLRSAMRAAAYSVAADAAQEAAGTTYESETARLMAEVETARLVAGAMRAAAIAWADTARVADEAMRAAVGKP